MLVVPEYIENYYLIIIKLILIMETEYVSELKNDNMSFEFKISLGNYLRLEATNHLLL